jgi:putative membrane protein
MMWSSYGPDMFSMVGLLLWLAIIGGVVALIVVVGPRRLDQRFRGAFGRPGPADAHAILARRFATGEITEKEYRERLSVLDEQSHRTVA